MSEIIEATADGVLPIAKFRCGERVNVVGMEWKEFDGVEFTIHSVSCKFPRSPDLQYYVYSVVTTDNKFIAWVQEPFIDLVNSLERARAMQRGRSEYQGYGPDRFWRVGVREDQIIHVPAESESE